MPRNLTIKNELERIEETFKHQDNILGKDILTIANKLNSSRSIMFHSHLEQSTVLNNPDFPRIFTNYENMVGEYSTSYWKADNDYRIIDKISKFPNQPNFVYMLVVKNLKTNEYDVIIREEGQRITENYAYRNRNECIDSKKKDDIIKQDEILYSSTAHDKNFNFCYGKNCKTLYMIDNRTIEDAIWCSESFAKKMKNTYIQEVEITVNNNDLLCNLYGNNEVNEYGQEIYKCFPDIGETVNNQVLASRRRIEYDSFLYDMQKDLLKRVNYNNDTVFYCDGIVIDIDIFCNNTREDLQKRYYNNQIVKYYDSQLEYYTKMYESLKPIVETEGNKYSDDLAFYYKKAKEYIDPNVRFCNDSNTDFNNLIIVFKILKENELHIGSKVVGRFGNKGVISTITPDDQMPTNQYGEHAEIVFNALGVINRLNPGQLFEQELNFLSDNIVRKSKSLTKLSDKSKLILNFIKDVNKDQGEFFSNIYKGLSTKDRKFFIKDIEEKGIYLHQKPFYDNVNFDELKELYKKYDWIKPYTFTIDGKPILGTMIMGDTYILRLKHEPAGKHSARSTSFLNMKKAPSRSNKYKKKQSLYSTTPIRLGEMEVLNLLLTQQIEEVDEFFKKYSSSKELRSVFIEALATGDVLNLESVNLEDYIDIDNEEDKHGININKEILDVLFKSCSIKINRTEIKD